MNKAIFYSLFLGVTAFSANDAFTQEFSLDQAVEYGLKNNPAAKNAGLDMRIAEKKIWETTTIGLPQISGEVGFQHFIDIPTSVAPAEAFGGPAGEFAELQFGTRNNASAGITLNQLIFSGTYLVGLQASRTYARFSEEQKIKTEAEIRDAIARAYYQALQAVQNRQVLEENLALAGKILGEMKALYANGFLEELDVEIFTLQEAQLKNALANAGELSKATTDLLKMQMGYPQAEDISLSDDLIMLADQAALQTAGSETFEVTSHIDFKLALSGEALSLLNIKKEKATRYPSLAGFINHSQNAYRDEFDFFNNGKWYPTTIAGLRLSVPIFDSRGQASRISQAKMEMEKVGNTRKMIGDQLKMEYRAAQASFTVAADAYATAKTNLALSEKILQKMTIKHKEGLAGSLDLTQSQNQHVATKMNLYGAASALLQAQARLKKITNK